MALEPNRIMREPTAASAAAVAATSPSKQQRLLLLHQQQQQQQQQLSGNAGGGGGGVEEEKEEILLVDTTTDVQNIMDPHRPHPTLAGLVQHHYQGQRGDGGGGGGAGEQREDAAQDVGDENGFRAQLESVSRFLFGSCGGARSAVETAASLFFVPGHSSGTCAVRPHRGPGGVAAAAGLMGGVRHASHHDMQQPQQQRHPQQQQQHYYHYQQQQQQQARPALSIADELRQLAIAEGRNPNAHPVPQAPRSSDIPKFLGEDAVHSIDDDNISAISQHTLEDMARRGYNAVQQQQHPVVHPMMGVNVNVKSGSSTNSSSRSSSRDQQETQANASTQQ
jgi:hypothetical protein